MRREGHRLSTFRIIGRTRGTAPVTDLWMWWLVASACEHYASGGLYGRILFRARCRVAQGGRRAVAMNERVDTYKRVRAASAQRDTLEDRGGGAVSGSLWGQHSVRCLIWLCRRRAWEHRWSEALPAGRTPGSHWPLCVFFLNEFEHQSQ